MGTSTATLVPRFFRLWFKSAAGTGTTGEFTTATGGTTEG